MNSFQHLPPVCESDSGQAARFLLRTIPSGMLWRNKSANLVPESASRHSKEVLK